MNGQPLQAGQLDAYLQQNPNQIRVLRNGQTVVLDTNRPMPSAMVQGGVHSGLQGGVQGRPRLGITMNPTQNAVIVSSVAAGSPAQMAGIRPGDQILAVNGRPVNNPNAMIQAVGQANANQSLALQLRRNGQVIESQVMLSGSGIGQHRAGYAPQGQGMAQGDLNSRINQLEQMLQDLRNEVRQGASVGAQGAAALQTGGQSAAGSTSASGSLNASANADAAADTSSDSNNKQDKSNDSSSQDDSSKNDDSSKK
jgi:membrane-associated protease RseP (regulator of RpoE activity)